MRCSYSMCFIGPWLKTDGAYKITRVRVCVHASVHPFVTAFLKNHSKDFSEIWYEVRAP